MDESLERVSQETPSVSKDMEKEEGRMMLERLFTVAGVHTQKDLAKCIGVASVPSISNAVSKNQFPFNWIKTLYKQHPEYSLNWIIFGEGEKFKNSFTTNKNNTNIPEIDAAEKFISEIDLKYRTFNSSLSEIKSSINKYNESNKIISVLADLYSSLNNKEFLEHINEKVDLCNKKLDSCNEKIEKIFSIIKHNSTN